VKVEQPADCPQLYPATLSGIVDSVIEFGDDETPGGRCITRTRFGMQVLQQLGVAATPLPCILLVGNPDAGSAVRAGLPKALWRAPIACVEVDPDDPANPDPEWGAHLVVEWRVEGVGGLMDLDLQRYTRPNWGIHTRAMTVQFPDDFRDEPVGYFFDDGCVAVWTPARHRSRFKRGSAWRTPWDQGLVDMVVERVLDEAPAELERFRSGQ
jgi:hypothetical protein